jgi:HEAT repeat protein
MTTIQGRSTDLNMDLNLVIELLANESFAPGPAAGSDAAGSHAKDGFLRDAMSTFPTHRADAATAISKLQLDDPSGFAASAVRILSAIADKKSPAVQFLVGLLFTEHQSIDPLVDENLPWDTAVAVARSLAVVDPQLDARLLRKVLAEAGVDVKSIRTARALRVLRLAEALSDCSRLSVYLIQFLRHPSPEVRSKAALLLGHCNLNLPRVMSLLDSDEERLRANVIESLWGHESAAVRKVLHGAVKDPCARASTNALVALCRMGDREAIEIVRGVASSADPGERARAAWAMGESTVAGFLPVLEVLAGDLHAKVRSMAEKSRAKLRDSLPNQPPQPDQPPQSGQPPQAEKPAQEAPPPVAETPAP